MSGDLRFCECCRRKLNPAKIVGLELDQRVDQYHDFGNVPTNKSQGWFDFGPACAKRARAKARTALAAIGVTS